MRSSASTIVNRLGASASASASASIPTRIRGLSTLTATTSTINSNRRTTTTTSRIQHNHTARLHLLSGLKVPTAYLGGIVPETENKNTYVIRSRSRSLSSAAAAAVEEEPPRRRKLETKNPIVVTERAADRIKTILQGENAQGALGIRLGVKRRGCNGLSYTLNYAFEKPKKDLEMESNGVKVFVEPMALFSVVGTVMDWEETELSSEFTFKNPNSKGECGCGESFTV